MGCDGHELELWNLPGGSQPWGTGFYVLEDARICLLVIAAHIKQVPGRKTDMQECMWIAHLLECGLRWGQLRATGTNSGAP